MSTDSGTPNGSEDSRASQEDNRVSRPARLRLRKDNPNPNEEGPNPASAREDGPDAPEPIEDGQKPKLRLTRMSPKEQIAAAKRAREEATTKVTPPSDETAGTDSPSEEQPISPTPTPNPPQESPPDETSASEDDLAAFNTLGDDLDDPGGFDALGDDDFDMGDFEEPAQEGEATAATQAMTEPPQPVEPPTQPENPPQEDSAKPRIRLGRMSPKEQIAAAKQAREEAAAKDRPSEESSISQSPASNPPQEDATPSDISEDVDDPGGFGALGEDDFDMGDFAEPSQENEAAIPPMSPEPQTDEAAASPSDPSPPKLKLSRSPTPSEPPADEPNPFQEVAMSQSPFEKAKTEDNPEPDETPAPEDSPKPRLKLSRPRRSRETPPAEPEAEKPDAPASASEPEDSQASKKPFRMSLKRRDPEEESVQENQAQAQPMEEATPIPDDIDDGGFGILGDDDMDFGDMEEPAEADWSSQTPMDETPAPQSSASDAGPAPATPEVTEDNILRDPPRTGGLKLKNTSLGDQSETDEDPAPSQDSVEEPLGWDGAPESQMPHGGKEGDSGKTGSGLKLKSRGDGEADQQDAPAGMSHGTLTPFERTKAVEESVRPGDTSSPETMEDEDDVSPSADDGKQKKRKGKQKPPKKAKAPKPAKASKKKGVSDSKKTNQIARLVFMGVMVFLFLGLGLGILMILGIGPFAADDIDEPYQPSIRVEPPPPTDSESEVTSSTEDQPGIQGPISTTLDTIAGVETNTALTNEVVDATVDPETDPNSEDPSTEPITTVNEAGKTVVVVQPTETETPDTGQMQQGGAVQVAVSDAPLPLEEETLPDPEKDPRIQQFIDNLVIQGTIGGGNPKIIVNNTPYTRGTFINLQLGVKFVGIRGRIIYFQDRQGAVYQKRN